MRWSKLFGSFAALVLVTCANCYVASAYAASAVLTEMKAAALTKLVVTIRLPASKIRGIFRSIRLDPSPIIGFILSTRMGCGRLSREAL